MKIRFNERQEAIEQMEGVYGNTSLLDIYEEIRKLEQKIETLDKALNICCNEGYSIEELTEALQDILKYTYELNIYFEYRLEIAD